MTEKGLREIIAADSKISDIDGQLGRLWYVGYDIADLADNASYEEIVYLLHTWSSQHANSSTASPSS